MRRVLPVLLLSGCATGLFGSVDTGTDSPCGEGAPATCEERLGDTCMGSEFPPGYLVDRHFTDANIREWMEIRSTCGYQGVTMCEDERFFATTGLGENTVMQGGEPVQEEGGSIGVSVWRVDTRERVAMGFIAPPSSDTTSCRRLWFGDSAGFPCLEEAYQRAAVAMPSCTADVECDYCACQVNEVTDATSPECMQP